MCRDLVERMNKYAEKGIEAGSVKLKDDPDALSEKRSYCNPKNDER